MGESVKPPLIYFTCGERDTRAWIFSFGEKQARI